MLLQEIRHAVRMLARNPGWTAVATLSLGLGIGANTAVFSVADTLLLRPLPVHEPDAIVTVGLAGPDGRIGGISYPNYRDLREESRSFEGLIAYQRQAPRTFARSPKDVREMRLGMLVSDNFFDVLGVRPALGRMFTPEEGRVPGRDGVVVLGYHFWKHMLAGDASIVNQVVWINGIDFTVVGVAPESFTGMDETIVAFFVPIMMAERLSAAGESPLEDRAARVFAVKGRLNPGASRESSRAELTTLWTGLEQRFPDANRNRSIAVLSQLEDRIQDEGPNTVVMLAMLMALVAIVLVIACANVASLMLGRSLARSREIAVRLALGMSRLRLLRQLLIESLVLALIGCALGLAFADGGLSLLRAAQAPSDLRVDITPQLDLRMLSFTLLAGVVSAVLCGLAPAWQSLKTQLVGALKTAGSGETTHQRTIGRNMLVVAQIALSTVLLVATGMLLGGFRKALVVDPGFRTDHLMLMSLDTSTVRYAPGQTADFYRRLEDRARALPGVESVALTSWVLLDRGGSIAAVIPEGYQLPPGQQGVSIFHAVVNEQYFRTMKTDIIRGRTFTQNDNDRSSGVVIVNEELAKRYWPNQDPIGKRIRLDGRDSWLEVVGLTATGKYLGIGEAPRPFFYLPFAQHGRTAMSLLVETTAGDPASLAAPLRGVVRDLDVNQPIFNVQTLASFYEGRAIQIPLRILRVVGTMGLVGLSLALVGLYGLVSYSVARRTREIGLRMAVGADGSDVLKMVLRQGLMLSMAGILVGGLASVAVTGLLTAGLVGLGTPNPATYVLVPIALIALTLAASYIPARRASVVDPLTALRYE